MLKCNTYVKTKQGAFLVVIEFIGQSGALSSSHAHEAGRHSFVPRAVLAEPGYVVLVVGLFAPHPLEARHLSFLQLVQHLRSSKDLHACGYRDADAVKARACGLRAWQIYVVYFRNLIQSPGGWGGFILKISLTREISYPRISKFREKIFKIFTRVTKKTVI